jgi:hypothetical protein
MAEHAGAFLQAPIAAAIDDEPSLKEQPTRRFRSHWDLLVFLALVAVGLMVLSVLARRR